MVLTWYLVERRKKIDMFSTRMLDFDISQNARAKTLEKLLLTNICQDKFIEPRNSLAFDLLVQLAITLFSASDLQSFSANL